MMEGWKIKRIEEIAKTTSGGTPSRTKKEFYNGEFLWVKSGELDDNYIIDTEEKITQNAIKNSSAKLFPKETILMAMYGATVGKTAILKKEATTNQAVCGILPNEDNFNNEFLRFQLIFKRNDFLKQRYGGAQPNISQTIIKTFEVILPSLPEQRKIAHVLSTVQKAIEQQDNLIRTTTELKKALMQNLFTKGTRGEPQKETEIGLVPESWEVVKMGECLLQTQYGLSTKGNNAGEVPILRMTNQKDGYISSDNLQYVNISEKELNKFKVNKGDVIFNRTNSFELVGRTAIFDLSGDYVFASYLIRLITNPEKLYPEFLNLYLNADETQNRLKSIATRGVSQSNISATRLSGFVIPSPSLAEQREIISILKAFNVKINCIEKKKHTLITLFKTLLHELMTGQRRVHELEFDGMIESKKHEG